MNTSRKIIAKAEIESSLREAINKEAEEHSGDSVFEVLSRIDVKPYVESKPCGGGRSLDYLPWATGWSIVKKIYPDADYTVYESESCCLYHTDGKTAWVKVGVTIEGQEYIERLPVMDNRNNSIQLEKVTSRDASDSIQRCMVKAMARHGLGLSLYTKDGLPEGVVEIKTAAPEVQGVTAPAPAQTATGVMTPEHTRLYRQAMAAFEQKYANTMGEPLYKAVLREMGVKTFKEILDIRFLELMEKIDSLHLLVQE